MFQASSGTVAAVLTLATVAAAALVWMEWRRPDRRWVGWRIGATALAVLALALLGLRPAHRVDDRSRGGTEAALYLPGSVPKEDQKNTARAALRFVLPAATEAPADAVVLPDVAALPRRYPDVGTVHLYGDGLEPFDLASLRSLRVIFHPSDRSQPAAPVITFLRCPRELPLGEPLELQGRVDDLPPGETATLTLTAPDGTTSTAATFPAGQDGQATFVLRGPAPPAAGRFDWRLRLARGAERLSEETLGVAVVRPVLPRVLVLESAPRFDTAALRRWFEQAGGSLRARTQIGKEIYRFAGGSDGAAAPAEFGAVDAALLTGYDLLLADGRSLRALQDVERAALRTSVSDNGVGVLVLADDAALSPSPEAAKDPAAFLLPWTLRPVASGEPAGENADRSIRPRWPGMIQPIGTPVLAAPWEIVPGSGQVPLVRDEQGRVVAATSLLGRGQLGLTLVRETGRWTRANDPAAFAVYWSHLFSTLARPGDASGHWSLPSREIRLIRVDEPLEIIWQSVGTSTPEPALVTDETGEEARLPFIGDPADAQRWRTMFWPRRPGWHRVTLPGAAAPCDFRVDPPGTWPALTASNRRLATARFAADSVDAPTRSSAAASPAHTEPVAAGWWWTAFLLGAGTLWVERRLTAGRSARTF